ncbi:serine hydrolase domain-containing protein [Roseomonas xinghualingensis]|uniref:serine hydrolase domain-containing protein n=1 Tax=Roseomonas xinghualingensis TaxID=2986475 RepID=UPI0021F22D0E|nr:serine hydrolase domain-containing protein [Roseomonas sp. SXEYE001]MCV4207181.1 beta-lactamase family protein [Roseomonas sp. SXEYE001]
MEREAQRGSFPGCVTLIARGGEIVHLEAHGHQDAARTRPMPLDAIFLQASMTKPITSAMAMMLVEEGLMKLSDPITNWMPELKELKVEVRRDGQTEDVPLARPITVQDLLRHTSGFIYANAAPSTRLRELYEQHNIEAAKEPISADEMLRRLGTIPLAHQPATTFHYSISTDVLGLLLERVSGRPLDALLQERLISPLGMRDTAWFVEPGRRARIAEAPVTDPQTEPMWRAYRILENPAGRTYFRGGAGLVSTAQDYIRFGQMIANGGVFEGQRYLAAPVVNYMLSDHIQGMGGSPTSSTGPGYGFGLGFGVRRQDGVGVAPGSTGDAMWAGAWGTSFTIDRAEGLVAILMAQGPSARVQTRMLFKNLVYGAMVESRRGIPA